MMRLANRSVGEKTPLECRGIESPAPVPVAFRNAVLAALAAGAALWWFFGGHSFGTVPQLVALAFVTVICLVPGARRRVTHAVHRIRSPSDRHRRFMAAGVFAFAVCYLIVTAIWQGRDLFPKWHDHQMTLVQAQMLARGRLWMPRHPCADFFETFYVFVKPVYASMYFPGAALFFVPAVWLHLPWWIMPVLASGALAMMLFLVVTDLTDAAGGLVAAVLLVSLWIFRVLSVWVMSHTVFTLLAITAIWAWLPWRKSGGADIPVCPESASAGGTPPAERTRNRAGLLEAARPEPRPPKPACPRGPMSSRFPQLAWAAVLGAAIGWAAITRPVDAFAYAVPLAVAVLWDLRRDSWRARIQTISFMLAAAAPFLSLQLILDRGVTGSFLKTPVHYYAELEFPGLSAYGGMPDPNAHATSKLPQKQLLGQEFVLPNERQFASQSLPTRLKVRLQTLLAPGRTVPAAAVLLLLPTGLLGLRDPRRLVLVLPLVLFLAGYLFYPILLNHYCIAVAPAVILLSVLGATVIGNIWSRHRATLSTCIMLGLLSLAVTALPEFHPSQSDDDSWPATWFNYEVLPREVSAPALVLYHFEPMVYASGMNSVYDEPVYNVDVAWPDDAPIIRAHDLGDRDREIIEYYGRIQPERTVYLVDRADLKPRLLGMAGELAAHPQELVETLRAARVK